MNLGKTVFDQILQHLSRYEFNKYVTKYSELILLTLFSSYFPLFSKNSQARCFFQPFLGRLYKTQTL